MAKNLQKEIKEMKEVVDELRLIVKYLKFDVEATRRERDGYKKLFEEKK